MITELVHAQMQNLQVPYDYKELYNLQKVVDVLKILIQNKRHILIYGDYDVDGVTSISIMKLAIESLGGVVSYKVPHRIYDGYGINTKSVQDLVADVVLCVDNGTNATEAIEALRQRGIATIVIDHHLPESDTLPTEFIINPWQKEDKTEFKTFCAAALCYFVACELSIDKKLLNYCRVLAGLGTMADCMPLVGPNRDLAKYVYDTLKYNTKYGFDFLPKSEDLSFSTIPVINASGRLGDNTIAVEVLTSKASEEVQALADKMKELNNYRKYRTNDILNFVSYVTDKDIYVLINNDIEEGLIGIVAAQIVERIKKPAVIISNSRGSCRAPKGYNMFNIVSSVSDKLVNFGGHEGACGFTISPSKTKEVKEAFESIKVKAKPVPLPQATEISIDEITYENYLYINKLRPFGQDNLEPLFRSNNIKLKSAQICGNNEDTLRVTLPNGIVGIKFNHFEIPKSNSVDLIYTISQNVWRGEVSVQIRIKEVIEHV